MEGAIGIIGATGWIGQHLMQELGARGEEVVGFSRRPQAQEGYEWRQWDGSGAIDLTRIKTVINLAGEAIDQRWTESRKQSFHESRVIFTRNLVEAMNEAEVSHLLNASAIGYYGNRGSEKLTEDSPAGSGYLAGLTKAWEEEARKLRGKVCLLRTGVVLGKSGKAWAKMAPLFRWGLGGALGSGNQWMPWIHLADEIGAIIHCLDRQLEGPVNLVAESCTNAQFTKVVGKEMGRPTFFNAPAFALKLALGEFAEEGLLASVRVVPEILMESGYEFQYPQIKDATKELCDESKNKVD
jgi:uncharacterized protein (TIGR01777 family)